MAQLIQLIDEVVANKFALSGASLALGRHPESDIQLEDSAVSARHARLIVKVNEHFPQFQEYYVEDLGSTNGTFINEQPISGQQRLHHNDRLRLAWNQFKFVDDSEQNLDKTLHILPSLED